jgi:serine/threonine protein kinase
MTSRTITSVVTSDTMALNAAVFGYAGHSIVTPHQAIQQIWWTDERIQAKVTREFIISKLRSEEKFMLDHPVAFGNDLTNDSYLDRILEKARRLFLTLVETGVPSQIFSIIDDAWDDDDLPISKTEVKRLFASHAKNDKMKKKFYNTQFTFLLRSLTQGSHISYGPTEVIPLQYIHRLAPAAALQGWFKMHLPNQSDKILVRRRITLGTKDEIDPAQEESFLRDIDTYSLIKHPHVAPIWASYTSKSCGYVLTTFEAEHTLKSFIDFRQAASIQKLSKEDRVIQVLTWLHCLASALSAIHEQGLSHSAIMPSNILIDSTNQIAFGDLGKLKVLQGDKKIDPTEVYNYTPPEKHAAVKHARMSSITSETSSIRPRFSGQRRKMSVESIWSTSTTAGRSLLTSSHSSRPSLASLNQNLPPLVHSSKKYSISSESSASESSSPRTPDGSPIQFSKSVMPQIPSQEDKLGLLPTISNLPGLRAFSPATKSTSSLALADFTFFPSNSPIMPFAAPTVPSFTIPAPSAQKGDIYALGCVYLDILTYALRKKPAEFVKHRTTKHRRTPSTDPVYPSSTSPTSTSTGTTVIGATSSGSRIDSSFHANHAALETWMDTLSATTSTIAPPIHALDAVESLLALVRGMLNKNPALRPTAATIKDRVESILNFEAGIVGLCCRNPNAVLMKSREGERPLPPLPGRKPVPIEKDDVLHEEMITMKFEEAVVPKKGMDFRKTISGWNWGRKAEKDRAGEKGNGLLITV